MEISLRLHWTTYTPSYVTSPLIPAKREIIQEQIPCYWLYEFRPLPPQSARVFGIARLYAISKYPYFVAFRHYFVGR